MPPRRTRRRDFIGASAAVASTLCVPALLRAQTSQRRPLIAWLTGLRADPIAPIVREVTLQNLLRGLNELGYVQGRDYDLVVKTNLFPDPVAELDEVVNRLKPDVIVAPVTWEAVSIRKATSTIPMRWIA